MYLDIKELSQYLNIKPSTLYAWVAQGKIPHVKICGLIRFRPEEIEAWVESFQQDRQKKHPQIPRAKGQADVDRLVDMAIREVKGVQ